MTIGAITHASVLAHQAGSRHPERPERVTAIIDHLSDSGLSKRLDWVDAEPAARDVLELAHQAAHLDLLGKLDAEGGGRLDPDTRMGPGSLEAAVRGSGAAVEAARRVLAGTWDGAVTIMRPPGHHAAADRAMGFCLLNHVAVAARWAIERGGAARVAIVDWDAHHGNGTQDIFWRDGSVLYASLHQYPFYPGTGWVQDTGEGPGAGLTINVPLPAGTAEAAYRRALTEVILPAMREFAPDLVFVSAGFDAHARDPLCSMRLLAGAFHRFARAVSAVAPGPVCVLEGGYDLDALAWGTDATVSALLGEPEPAGVPEAEWGELDGEVDADRWVDAAIAVHRT